MADHRLRELIGATCYLVFVTTVSTGAHHGGGPRDWDRFERAFPPARGLSSRSRKPCTTTRVPGVRGRWPALSMAGVWRIVRSPRCPSPRRRPRVRLAALNSIR